MSGTRFNHSRVNRRQQMRRQGVEDAREEDAPFFAPLIRKKPRRPRPSKADVRAEADRLVAEFLSRQR